MKRTVDRPFLITIGILVIAGFFIFTSASLGLLAREGARFSSVAFNQIFFGIFLGTIALFITSNIRYRWWRKYSLYIFLFSLGITMLVFVPGIGIEFSGAKRWILIGPFSFQPAELLKLAFVIYFAAWLSGVRTMIHTFRYGLLPVLILFSVVGLVLLSQPDTGTFLVIGVTGVAMYIAAGARWRDIFYLGGIGVFGITTLAFLRPYIMNRLLIFFNPSLDPLGTSYQIQQSLITIGSGGLWGRGFGQSIQKFSFLPEPIGDSIFAVAAEEFGFLGGTVIIGLFLFLAYRGFKIATKSQDYFGGLLVIGIVILIVFQSFTNIGSMLGVLPLTGLPLLFISHGGSALLLALGGAGIVLNVSKYSSK